MLKFLKKLFKIKPQEANEKMIVKNIIEEQQKEEKEKVSKIKYAATGDRRIFFIDRSNIGKMEDDNKGLITAIALRNKAVFTELKCLKNPTVVDKKRGVSSVEISVTFDTSTDEALKTKLKEIGETAVSFLYFKSENECLLLGEHTGLSISETKDNEMTFSVTEEDTFYKVDIALAKQLSGIA